MPIKYTEEQRLAELKADEQDREYEREKLQERYAHEKEIARINLSYHGKQAHRDTMIGLCKIPTLPIAVLAVMILVLAGKEVPEALLNFLTLR